MKPMNDRNMKVPKGEPDDAFFPANVSVKHMKRPGEIKDFKYPDTEEAIFADQESFVRDASRNQPKKDFRH